MYLYFVKIDMQHINVTSSPMLVSDSLKDINCLNLWYFKRLVYDSKDLDDLMKIQDAPLS